MASKVQLDIDLSKMKYGSYEGMNMPEVYEPVAEHLPKVKDMDIRDDDIMLCSYRNSGTHWLFRVLDMLQRGQAVYDKRTMESTFLDTQRVDLMDTLDSPRVLVSHLPAQFLPKQVPDKRTKLVHVYRNPRAVLVSMYFLRKTVEGLKAIGNMTNVTLERMVGAFMTGQDPYGGWPRYMDAIQKFQQDNSDFTILNIFYEEMTLNPVDTVKKLADYLDKTVTPEFCQQVAEACSFKKQKESEEAINQTQTQLRFYRKVSVTVHHAIVSTELGAQHQHQTTEPLSPQTPVSRLVHGDKSRVAARHAPHPAKPSQHFMQPLPPA